jgi:hypothetical protein
MLPHRGFLLLAAMLLPGIVPAQSTNPLTYFPHRLGDTWQYWVVNTPEYRLRTVISDTLGPDGAYYSIVNTIGNCCPDWYRIDTTNYTVKEPRVGVYKYLLLQLGAQTGDRWITYRADSTWPRTTIARVVASYFAWVAGGFFHTKEVDYTDSASGLLLTTYYFADTLGIIGEDTDAFPVYRLRAARINGRTFGSFVGVEDPVRSEVPLAPRLAQNYPNPFNPSTTIRFTLAADGHVSLVVRNLLGQEIRRLLDERREKGEYRLEFYAGDLPSGVYLYTLTTAEGASTRRMVLLR